MAKRIRTINTESLQNCQTMLWNVKHLANPLAKQAAHS